MKLLRNLFVTIGLWHGLSASLHAQVSEVVNHSTGTLGVGLPLYTLSEGVISVPINLSYDASGVQVDAVASNVGLNWSLNTGGRIVRIPRGGLSDESVFQLQGVDDGFMRGYYHQAYAGFAGNGTLGAKLTFARDLAPDLFVLQLGEASVKFMILPIPNSTQKRIVYQDLSNSDIKIELIPFTGTEPNCNIANNYSFETALFNASAFYGFGFFKVTAADGAVYHFGESQDSREYAFSPKDYFATKGFTATSTNTSEAVNSFKGMRVICHPTVWNVSRVYTRNVQAGQGTDFHQEIVFNYKRTKLWARQKAYLIPAHRTITSGNCTYPVELDVDVNEPMIPYERIIRFGSQIETIQGANQKVTFNNTGLATPSNLTTLVPEYQNGLNSVYERNRQDIDNHLFSQLPSEISVGCINNEQTIANPILTILGEEIITDMVITDLVTGKKIGYVFLYDYFNGYNSADRTTTNAEQKESSNERLRLVGCYPMQFVSGGGIELEKGYRFAYNSLTLPARWSRAKDHWGYYNGADLNASYTALVSRDMNIPDADDVYQSCQFSNMEPNAAFGKAGTLVNVTLPTGGVSNYEYEIHDCDNYYEEKRKLVSGQFEKINPKGVGGLRIAKITTYDPVSNVSLMRSFEYKKQGSNESSGFLSIWPFYLNKYKGDGGNLNEQLLSVNEYGQMLSMINGAYITYRRVIEKQVTSQGNQETDNGFTEYEFYHNERSPFLIKSEGCAQNGQYTDDVNNDCVWGKCLNLYYDITWTQVELKLPTFDPTKGFPKSMKVFRKDENGQYKTLSETAFEYTTFDSTGNYTIKSGLYLAPSKSNLVPNGSKMLLPDLNAKIHQLSGFGSMSNTGLHRTYAQHGALISAFIIAFVNTYIPSVTENATYNVANYKQPVFYVRTTKQTDKTYDQSGTSGIELTTEYFYETTQHTQPTRIKTFYTNQPNLEPVEQITKYSKEYIVPSSVSTNEFIQGIRFLKAWNILVPIETVVKRNGKVIVGNFIDYHSNETVVTGYEYAKPRSIYQLELEEPLSSFTMSNFDGTQLIKDNHYVLKSRTTTYNVRGLPTETINADDPTISIKSEYNSTYHGLLPTEIKSMDGTSLARSENYEYEPISGLTKATAPDNTFVTNHYDGFGRPKMVKDHQNNVLQANDYLFADAPAVDDNIDITLVTDCGTQFIKTLTNGTTVSMSEIQTALTNANCQRMNVRVVSGAGNFGSVVASLTGTLIKSTAESGNLSLFNGGVTPLTGSYQLTAKVYTRTNSGGYLISQKKINFTITN